MRRRLSAVLSLVLIGCWSDCWAAESSVQLPAEADFVEAVKHDQTTRVDYCLALPADYPPPTARSKLRKFGWYADYVKDAARGPDGVKQLMELDTLAAVGLLQKEEVSIAAAGSLPQPAWRYRLTAKGWSQLDDRRNCFVYGKASYLGFVGGEDSLDGESSFRRSVRVGLSGPDALPSWARDPGVQQAFPQIARQLEGQRVVMRLERRDGRWKSEDEGELPGLRFDSLTPEARRKSQTYADLPDPTRSELEGKLSLSPERICLVLPGKGRLPVDKVFPGDRYRFGIYLNKPQRSSSDAVVAKTLPTVERLVAARGLVRLPDEQVVDDAADKGKSFTTAVYALAPQLQALLQDNCISLGPITHQFVDIQYKKFDLDRRRVPSFTFKKILRLNSPPSVLAEAALQAAWPDLRGALQLGLACMGEYDFKKDTRETGSGAASCWYMFDGDEDPGYRW